MPTLNPAVSFSRTWTLLPNGGETPGVQAGGFYFMHSPPLSACQRYPGKHFDTSPSVIHYHTSSKLSYKHILLSVLKLPN